MTPGVAAVCTGTVFHRRAVPQVHEFRNPVGYVWLDPDRPGDLCAAHPWWSATRPAPARFRRRDYGSTPSGSLADAARDDVATVLDHRPTGDVRMLTQIRRWGWLFNPITVYVVWNARTDSADSDADRAFDDLVFDDLADPSGEPVGVVLEVTNTPWKERHRYPVALRRDGDWFVGSADKQLHVSPFLDESHRYDIRLRGQTERVELAIDVVPDGADAPIVATALDVSRRPATRHELSAALRRPLAATHRVSFGIHLQAVRLWLKRVPFVVHPRKREAVS
jgi:DUF1365 family protein